MLFTVEKILILHQNNKEIVMNELTVLKNIPVNTEGRDWYDFEWYVRWNVPLDFKHLLERIREFRRTPSQ